MERGYQMLPLLHQDRIAVVSRQYLGALAVAPDHGGAYEHSLEIPANRFALHLCNAAVELPSIRVPLHADVHQAERFLRRIRNLRRHQNRTRARAEDRMRTAEFA